VDCAGLWIVDCIVDCAVQSTEIIRNAIGPRKLRHTADVTTDLYYVAQN